MSYAAARIDWREERLRRIFRTHSSSSLLLDFSSASETQGDPQKSHLASRVSVFQTEKANLKRLHCIQLTRTMTRIFVSDFKVRIEGHWFLFKNLTFSMNKIERLPLVTQSSLLLQNLFASLPSPKSRSRPQLESHIQEVVQTSSLLRTSCCYHMYQV
jgi:hypothetical protein